MGLLGRRKPAIDVVLDAPASAEIVSVCELLDDGNVEKAFTRLYELKAQKTPRQYVDYLRALCFIEKQSALEAVEALKEELRFFPENQQARALLDKIQPPEDPAPADRDAEFRELLKIVRPHTMVGEPRLYSLYNLAKDVCAEDIPGNFVECGVAAGGSSALLAAVIARYSKRPRILYCFDTFCGMPDTTALDVHAGQAADATGWGSGTCAAPEQSLLEVCGRLNVAGLVHPVKGLFADTLPRTRAEIGAIAFLHMDGDWHSSTRDILENLFDQVGDNARIQIDDYGYWEGCKRAVEEFEAKRGLKLDLHTIDATGVWTRKGSAESP